MAVGVNEDGLIGFLWINPSRRVRGVENCLTHQHKRMSITTTASNEHTSRGGCVCVCSPLHKAGQCWKSRILNTIKTPFSFRETKPLGKWVSLVTRSMLNEKHQQTKADFASYFGIFCIRQPFQQNAKLTKAKTCVFSDPPPTPRNADERLKNVIFESFSLQLVSLAGQGFPLFHYSGQKRVIKENILCPQTL